MHQSAYEVVEKLKDNGFEAFFAGGWVRDYLMGHDSDDIDIATNASVEEVQRLFPKTIPVGIAFGIVIVVHGDHQFEVATFRKDLDYKDGRRPEGVEMSTAEEDALRRDFTVNGMFYDPLDSEVIDYVDGKADIEAKIIRAIGDPTQRFKEDRLRMIRAIRYACRFHFTIEKNTEKAIEQYASQLFPSVAIERVWQEFCKMAKFNSFGRCLKLLLDVGLLHTIFPQLKEHGRENYEELFERVATMPHTVPVIGGILELFAFETFEQVEQFCAYLKLSNSEVKFAKFYTKYSHLMEQGRFFSDKMSAVQRVNFLSNPLSHDTLLILSHRLEKEARASLLQDVHADQMSYSTYIERIKGKNPLITSKDLMQLGVKPGIKMGELLKRAEVIAIENILTEKEEVLPLLKKEL